MIFVPIYILLSTFTSEGRKTIKKRSERIKEINKEIEAFGAKVLQQYAVLGKYDFVNIVEAPNNDAIARVSIELDSRGTVHVMSMPTMDIGDFLSTLKEQQKTTLSPFLIKLRFSNSLSIRLTYTREWKDVV